MFRSKVISKYAIVPPVARVNRSGLAICLVVRNEAAHIAEWIAFHLKAGVSHFIIYDNGCSDGTIDVARAHLAVEQLTVMPWDQKLSDGRSGVELHNQSLAFAHCLRNFGGAFDWMAFVDVDEFMVPNGHPDLLSALEPLAGTGQVSLPWHMFGRCGHDQSPADGILANYTQRARDPLGSAHALNWKCIVDPCRITGVRVHGFDLDGEAVGVNDIGQVAKHKDRASSAFYSNAAIQLNHYYTRSGSELEAKISRGSNKTVEAQKHRKRVMRIVDAIEADTIEDRAALNYLDRG